MKPLANLLIRLGYWLGYRGKELSITERWIVVYKSEADRRPMPLETVAHVKRPGMVKP